MALRFRTVKQAFDSYTDNSMIVDSERIGKRMWIAVRHSSGEYLSMVTVVKKGEYYTASGFTESSGLDHYDCPKRLLDQIVPKTATAKAWRVRVAIKNNDAPTTQRVRTRTRT